MKRILAMVLGLVLVLPLMVSCGKVRYDYDLAEYIDLGSYQPVSASFADPSLCTEEEVDHALFQVMLTYALFEKKEGTAELYNKINVEYDIYYEGEPMEDYHKEDYEIVIGSEGSGELDYQLGKEFIGASIGATKEVEYTFPSDDFSLGAWAGMTVTARATLKTVYQQTVPECTDEFVSDLDQGMETVADFREQLKTDIMSRKEEDKRAAVYRAFIEGVTVKQYPKKELQEYIDSYTKDSKDLAEDLGMSYAEYLQEYLETDVESFEAMAKKEAQENVKVDMACVQVSRLMNTILSEEEYNAGLQVLYDAENTEEEFSSLKEFEKYHGKNEIRNRLLWKKTFNRMVDEAVRLETAQ
jgi:FKBP-type peptidyl-prolyl cis-trans isomerase (trigger factor)